MQLKIIDGNIQAERLLQQLRTAVGVIKAQGERPPCLALVLVGNDPETADCVRAKARVAETIGMTSREVHLASDTSESDVLRCISLLNLAEDVDGIFIQLPLPIHIRSCAVIDAISPTKDVTCLHPFNVANFYSGGEGIVPCLAYGCMLLIKSVVDSIAGMDAIVIGRSSGVGKPLTHLLSAADVTVTLAHANTQQLAEVCRRADLVISAAGHPELVRGNWIKPGAIVIDVGNHRVPPRAGETKSRLVGDVAFEELVDIAGALTPVPGGVGPMSIPCMLRNAVIAASRGNAGFEAEVEWEAELTLEVANERTVP